MGGEPSGIRSWPRAERPREKLAQNGPEALSPAELLALLLRTGDSASGRSALDLARDLWAFYREEWGELAQATSWGKWGPCGGPRLDASVLPEIRSTTSVVQ